jgi:hypothetical protein
MMDIQTVSARLHTNSILTGMIAWKHFTAYNCSQNYKQYIKIEIKIIAKVVIKVCVQFITLSFEVLN